MNRTSQRRWLRTLTVVIAVLYAWVGLAANGRDRTLGLVGAAAILAALAIGARSRPAAVALLILGALPLAVLTWWSIATPVLAALCLVLGWPRSGRAPGSALPAPGPAMSARGQHSAR